MSDSFRNIQDRIRKKNKSRIYIRCVTSNKCSKKIIISLGIGGAVAEDLQTLKFCVTFLLNACSLLVELKLF